MKDLITSTFTIDIEPDYLKYVEYFQYPRGFFEVDISHYPDNTNLWLVSLTYDVRHSPSYALRMMEFYDLHKELHNTTINFTSI